MSPSFPTQDPLRHIWPISEWKKHKKAISSRNAAWNTTILINELASPNWLDGIRHMQQNAVSKWHQPTTKHQSSSQSSLSINVHSRPLRNLPEVAHDRCVPHGPDVATFQLHRCHQKKGPEGLERIGTKHSSNSCELDVPWCPSALSIDAFILEQFPSFAKALSCVKTSLNFNWFQLPSISRLSTASPVEIRGSLAFLLILCFKSFKSLDS